MKGKQNLEVMTRETANWRNSLIKLIEREEMKKLMKEERVAAIVVKMLEHRVLKKLWDNDREIFDIVVRVVKKKCNQEVVDAGEGDEEEDADFKKVAKIASDVMRDIAEEFKKFVKRDDTAVVVIKVLNTDDLEKLRKDGEEMAKILSKAEGIVRKEADHSDHGEEELLLPKHNEDVQPVNESFIKEKVASWRKCMGSLTAFLDDENFKKGLPDGAMLGLEVMDALSKSIVSEQVEKNDKSHRYCG
ncbi:uncharacterized protein LOC141613938 isoform X2 [Silene latifolia]|uniref:uncharacterized protein LOC141613938 isoform X2 n=1 Tax=Silene latifolia TaxID=37657 RepID=UPI003D77DC2B